RGGARGPAIGFGQYAVLRCWSRALLVDAPVRHAISVAPRVACGFGPRGLHFCARLRLAVLGRTTRTFGNRRRHAGDHSGLYGIVGDHFSADAAAYIPAGAGPSGGDRRSVRSGEPLGKYWRS